VANYEQTVRQWCTQEFFRGGSTNWVEDRGQREWGSGGSSPYSAVPLNLQMSETHILIRVLRMYFSRNCEFGLALSKLWNFGGGGPPPPSVCHCCKGYHCLWTEWLLHEIHEYRHFSLHRNCVKTSFVRKGSCEPWTLKFTYTIHCRDMKNR
jgi:hypothetical protein